MKRLGTPLIVGAAGAILLLILFPRWDPAAKSGMTIDRNEAIRRVRESAAKYGVNAGDWKAVATVVTDEKLRFYLSAFPNDPAAKLFTPMGWGILLDAPGRTQSIRMKLLSDGRPAEWEWKQAGRENAGPTVSPETVLQDFAGSSAPAFKATDRGSQASGEVRDLEWTYPLVAKLAVSQSKGRVVSAVMSPDYGRGFSYTGTRVAKAAGNGAAGFLRFVAFAMAFGLAIRGFFLGRLSWRMPAGLATAMVVWGGLMMWAGSDYQGVRYKESRGLQVQLDAADRNPGDTDFTAGKKKGANDAFRVGVWMSFLGPVCLPFLSAIVFGGAGFALASARYRRKWYSVELLLAGKIFTRQVSRPIAAGVLCGIAVAAAPFLVAPVFRGATLLYHDVAIFSAPAAISGLIQPAAMVPALLFLGLAMPAAVARRRKWLRIAGLALIAAVYLFGAATAFDWLLPSLLTAAIGMAIYYEVYRRFDLLAVAAAMTMAQAVTVLGVVLSQPASSLRDSGVRMLVALIAGTAAFVNFGIRGRDAADGIQEEVPEIDIPESANYSMSNRKRLEAEFQVARKAQQDALPATPPVIEGYSFSGSCDPAQQVGGDLYDLFPLPDGRLGIAVADVSGKGVPAALYMMVTKGLLTATAQDSSDLCYILRHINVHLYRACKKKVFVTMAAVAMDPAGRRLQYARAGHNPIVWRRAARGETLLRKPPGLVLGMCSAEQFARSLRLEELELEPGDAVVLYSDGVTEAINATMDQFGEERLMLSVERADGQSAEETRVTILRDLAEFTAGTPSRDDVTVVVIRVDGAAVNGASESLMCDSN